MNKNSEVSLVVADAFVMYYDNALGKWMASGGSNSVTISKVQILQNLVSNQFRIFAWNPINNEVLLTSLLYHNLRYQKAHATFHEWRDADTQLVYGIHFADTKEANLFGDVISKIFNSLESIYKQCKELQETIHLQSDRKSVSKPHSPCKMINSSSDNLYKREQSSPIKQTKSNQPKPQIHQAEESSLPNYENVNIILNRNQYQGPVNMKTLTTGSDICEANNRCQSSSDDSVHGLKRQPSSSASSGYATVASLLDQYSPINNKGASSIGITTNAYSSSIVESTSVLPTAQTTNPEEMIHTSFASQLQSAIQSRKKSTTTNNLNDLKVNPKSPSPTLTYRSIHANTTPTALSSSTPTPTPKPQLTPVEDIMSEMKKKLERRKQLIDGHRDPNNSSYSSSSSSSDDEDDVCCSNTSDVVLNKGGTGRKRNSINNVTTLNKTNSGGNTTSLIEQSLSSSQLQNQQLPPIQSGRSGPGVGGFRSRSFSAKFSEISNDNKTQLDEDKSQRPVDFKDKSGKINKTHTQKQQAGDENTQSQSVSSSSHLVTGGQVLQNVTAMQNSTNFFNAPPTKYDLQSVKIDILECVRNELSEMKREIIKAITTSKSRVT